MVEYCSAASPRPDQAGLAQLAKMSGCSRSAPVAKPNNLLGT